MKTARGLKKRWYMFRDLIGLHSKKYNYKNNYTKYTKQADIADICESGLKFYGQFTPKVDEFIYKRYFNSLDISGVCVECGVLDGLTDSSCKFFEETLGWKCYNFEPNPYNYKQLVKNRPNSVNLNLGLSDKKGKLEFNFQLSKDNNGDIIPAGNGSLLPYTETQKEAIRNHNGVVDSVFVDVINYKDFITENKITHIDLFVLDVEGVEPMVINGMQGADVLPDIMVIEINDKNNFPAIRKQMEELSINGRGYIYDITSFVNYFFIKKDMLPLFNFRKNISQ